MKNLIKSAKTPLISTGKLSRLYVISIFILTLCCCFKPFIPLSAVLTFLLSPISNTINLYDKIKNKIYIHNASLKIETSKVKIIAITGSNGKTSVKNILLKMLEQKYNVQATPASYNTPLGIAKFINNDLKKNTKYLILEYGARHKNDIKKLCNLFGADYGIVTTISNQHLESFKSTLNIFKAKNELPQFLRSNLCVFNIDNLYTIQMHQLKTGKKMSASIYGNADIYAQDIKIDNGQTKFNLVINKKSYQTSTALLGRHNILNICLCCALAKKLGIKDKQIIQTITSLHPTEHRLQLIKTNINILDDSFNCSPSSAKEALWVLKQFPNKKMIVTPGIIECGKEKYNINFELGKSMSFCDYCIIIGNENKQAILDGLKNSNNSMPIIFCEKTLEEAKKHFSKLSNNDTLLLLNDLPDDYQ